VSNPHLPRVAPLTLEGADFETRELLERLTGIRGANTSTRLRCRSSTQPIDAATVHRIQARAHSAQA
jgi:hypothetical protein